MRNIISLFLLCLLIPASLFANDNQDIGNLIKNLKGLKVSGKFYLYYQNGEESTGETYNKFVIKRTYITVKKQINSWLKARFTLDSHQDDDLKVRVKYAYGDVHFPDAGFVAKPHVEIGLVHTPWNDFESQIYHYRMRGKTYLDEIGVSSSADFGLVAMGYFGGEVDKDFQKSVNKKYAGRYGSFAVGLYNGGGYKVEENNENKVLHARVTVRPIPNDAMTGLQLSGYIITGKANVAETNNVVAPDYQAAAGMLTYEHQYATFYGQYVTGKGNKSGSWSDQSTYWGYSFHGEGKLGTNWRAMFRYDYFDPYDNIDDNGSNVLIAGVGYDFGKGNIVLLDYQVESWEASAVDNTTQIQASMQISF